jgi:hypothetical protein
VTLAHLHLIMNHVPTVGSVVALALLILGYARRNEHLKHVGLELLFVIAVLTLPVYVSGVAAHRELREIKEVSDDAIRIHQDVALFGFAWMEFAGFIAWVALWQWRRRGAAARGLVPVATALLIVSPLMPPQPRRAIRNASSSIRSTRRRCTAAGCGLPPRRCTSSVFHCRSVCCWP